MDDRLKILEMIKNNLISVEEGAKLLDALKQNTTKKEIVETNDNLSIDLSKESYIVTDIAKTKNEYKKEENNSFMQKILNSNKESGVKRKYKELVIKVKVERDNTDVNLNLPLTVVKMFGGLVKCIPNDSMATLKAKGVDLASIDLGELFDDIKNDRIENPEIINVTVDDEKDGKVEVKIYLN